MLLGSISEPNNVKTILDIGSGTGVLALMLAQKSNSEDVLITALESDNFVFEILRENINNKPFQTKIEVVHGQLQTYKPIVPFDYIICNPPYYLVNQTIDHLVESGLKNRLTQRNEAELPIRHIIDFLSKYLKYDHIQQIIQKYQHKFYFFDEVHVLLIQYQKLYLFHLLFYLAK